LGRFLFVADAFFFSLATAKKQPISTRDDREQKNDQKARRLSIHEPALLSRF
jgi:hypothetical protein